MEVHVYSAFLLTINIWGFSVISVCILKNYQCKGVTVNN